MSLVKSRHEVVCPLLIAGSLHISPKCREFYTSCIILHPILGYSMLTRPISCICIRITDEKAQMQMQVQGHWACPNELCFDGFLADLRIKLLDVETPMLHTGYEVSATEHNSSSVE